MSSGMLVVDLHEGKEVNGERQPDIVVYACGGELQRVNKKEYWAAMKVLKRHGMLPGEEAFLKAQQKSGVIPMAAAE